jgi:hypothetical protein
MRFRLRAAHEAVVGGQRRRLRAGVTIADSPASALAGDYVCSQLCLAPNSTLEPLDAAAVAAMQAQAATVSDPREKRGLTNAAIGVGFTGPSTGGGSSDG